MLLFWVFICGLLGYVCSSAGRDLGIHGYIGLMIAAAAMVVLTSPFFK